MAKKDGASSEAIADAIVDLNQDEPVTITFEELTYKVKVPLKKMSMVDRIKGISLSGLPRTEWEEKELLVNVTGTIRPNSMTALMGASGAGKSTLLDVLAKRKNTGVIEGEILVNGKPPGSAYKRLVAYVEQKDILLPTLTPAQLFYYTARLRLPAKCTTQFINQRVAQVIEELGLESCKDTIIGNAVIRGISGGQAKRVNIGVELITDPRVLFLDEPTTGLDSSTALEVMMAIRELTNRGRTTIATIHQPSTDVFNLFDKLLLLVDGNIVYLGDAQKALPYYQQMGFILPMGMNPADFLIAVIGGGTGHGEKMVEGPDVSKRYFIESYIKSDMMRQRMESTQQHKLSRRKTITNLDQAEQEPPQFINNQFHNWKWLLIRAFMSNVRNGRYWMVRFFRIGIMGALVASCFANQPKTQDGVYNIFSVFNYSTMLFGFGTLAFIPGLIFRRLFFQRERQASSYQVSAYYLAEIMSEWPAFIMQATLWTAIVYPSVGLRGDFGAVVCFYCALLMATEVGYGIAMFASYFGADMDAATGTGLPILLLSVLFSGFYIQTPQIPIYWKWAYYTSYLGYTLSIFSINQWPPGQNDGYVRCEGDVCMPWDNDDILVAWGTGDAGVSAELWVNWLLLFALYIFWRIMAYLALRFRRHDKR